MNAHRSFLSPLFLCWALAIEFAAPADGLPPGVPNPIGPDGKITPAIALTTKAYQDEAFRLVLAEANQGKGSSLHKVHQA